MKAVDYDERLYQVYAKGRALTSRQRATWAGAFFRHLPNRRPLRGVDVGCGTGRFTPLLAETFGGRIIGVEPSERMRAVATETSTHPSVEYRSGSATDTGLADSSVDFALAFLVWHHVSDKAAAARELARVVRPGGTLLLRSQFSDRMPDLWWYSAFPGIRELDASMYQTLAATTDTFTDAGWQEPTLDTVTEPSRGTYAARLEALETRALSTFEHLTEAQLDAGFTNLRQQVAADPDAPTPSYDSDLLVFRRP